MSHKEILRFGEVYMRNSNLLNIYQCQAKQTLLKERNFLNISVVMQIIPITALSPLRIYLPKLKDIQIFLKK